MICIRCNRFGILHWNPKIFLWWNARITPVKCYTTERRTYSSNVDDYGAASRRKILFIHGEWGSFVRKADSSEPPDPCKILIPSIKESSSWFSFYFFFYPSSLHLRPFIRFRESLPSRRASWLDSSLHFPTAATSGRPRNPAYFLPCSKKRAWASAVMRFGSVQPPSQW